MVGEVMVEREGMVMVEGSVESGSGWQLRTLTHSSCVRSMALECQLKMTAHEHLHLHLSIPNLQSSFLRSCRAYVESLFPNTPTRRSRSLGNVEYCHSPIAHTFHLKSLKKQLNFNWINMFMHQMRLNMNQKCKKGAIKTRFEKCSLKFLFELAQTWYFLH